MSQLLIFIVANESELTPLSALLVRLRNSIAPWLECRLVVDDGYLPLAVRLVNQDDDGHDLLLLRDQTASLRKQQRFEMGAKLFDMTHEAMLVLDHEFRVIEANQAALGLGNYQPDTLLGQVAPVFRGDQGAHYIQRIKPILQSKSEWIGEMQMSSSDGEPLLLAARIKKVSWPELRKVSYLLTYLDHSKVKGYEQQIAHLVHHDALTGLGNRTQFRQHLQYQIEQVATLNQKLALLVIDIEHFSQFNRQFGELLGDQLLSAFAKRLYKACQQESSTCYRLSADQFMVLWVPMQSIADIEIAVHELAQRLCEPYDSIAPDWPTRIKVGVGIYPNDGLNDSELVNAAVAALKVAKSKPDLLMSFHDKEMDKTLHERYSLTKELAKAISNDELKLVYQPKVNAQNGRIMGAEALLRWQSKVKGPVSPSVFIKLAEEANLIMPIGEWVLENAIQQWAKLYIEGCNPGKLAINLSPAQMNNPTLALEIAGLCQRADLPCELVELEITEGLLLEDSDRLASTLLQLKQQGFSIALDDFGTGYSSLAYLANYSLDWLKIDRSFVMPLTEQCPQSTFISTIMRLAQALNLKVVAEGVETELQWLALRDYGCDVLQGYLFSPPIPLASYKSLLQNDSALAALSKPVGKSL